MQNIRRLLDYIVEPKEKLREETVPFLVFYRLDSLTFKNFHYSLWKGVKLCGSICISELLMLLCLKVWYA